MHFFKRWLNSLWFVIKKPTPNTFKRITDDVDNIFIEAIICNSILATLAYTLLIILGYIGPFRLDGFINFIFLVSLVLLFFVFYLNLVKEKLFNDKTYSYEKLLFSIVLILIIMTIMDSFLIAFFPDNNYLPYAVILYGVVIMIVAIKAITKLNYWQSLLNFFLSFILTLISSTIAGFFFGRLITLIPNWFKYF
jgi:hypothetical protein